MAWLQIGSAVIHFVALVVAVAHVMKLIESRDTDLWRCGLAVCYGAVMGVACVVLLLVTQPAVFALKWAVALGIVAALLFVALVYLRGPATQPDDPAAPGLILGRAGWGWAGFLALELIAFCILTYELLAHRFSGGHAA